MSTEIFATDKIGLACYLMLRGISLSEVLVKGKGRATFVFGLTPDAGVAHETAYTMSEHSRFFETFKYLRSRALRGK